MNFNQLFQKMRELDQPVAEEKQADKDYDGDGEVESGKDEYMGSRMKAAALDDDDEVGESYDTVENLDQLVDEVQAEVDECGLPGMSNMPSGMMGMPNKQQDNVSMNLSMNGSGSGGIRDLMAILKNIESGDHSHGDIELPGMGDMDNDNKPSIMISKNPILGDEKKEASPAGFDQASTSPDPVVFQSNFPTDTGDDLHKPKNSYSDKPYRGDNPMAVEGIKNRLDSLYQEVKSR